MATTCISIIKLARVPFPFNLSNPPILGAPGVDCLQLPEPKTIHDNMGKGRDIVLRVDIQRAATKRQILGICSSHIMLIGLPSIMFSSNPNP
ncbi:unnamed protein product [Miscanthus lutarioriparius]|uniref:Uncharacterized protein n=1 Tax=Miscanthus lutarioriparius TaxID=422564 RepID=A0A811S8E4_9POAL|nr:unnamed protein product [Miscanthus lutarioriparius]